MYKFYILSLLTFILVSSVIAKTAVTNIRKDFKQRNELYKTELENKQFENEITSTKSLKNTYIINHADNTQSLKSASTQEQCLDSLLIEQWNETTGQIEPYQLERWTWNDKGQGDTWEVYDWDISSAQWIPNDKEHYEWDENGNKIVHMDFDPDSITGEWFITGKNDWEFDENGNQIYYDYMIWNAVDNEWSIESQETTTYYGNGGHMAVDQTIGSTGNELQNEYKEEIINDENGNTIAASLYEWDNTTNTWTPFIHNTFTYDSNGNRIVENWVIDFFDSHKKIEKSYDSLGQLVQTITSQLDYTSNQFSYTKKEDYVFTNDSLLLSHTYYLWNDSSLIWDKNSEYNYRYNSYNKLQYREYAKIGTGSYSLVLQSRKEYIYDDEDEINGEINTRWDTENAQWINLTKLEFAKNEENKLIFEADFTWDSLSVDWIPETKEIHNYDSSGNLIKHNYFGKDTLTTQLIEEWSNDFSYDLTVSFSDLIYPAEFEYWHISKLKDFEQYSNVMLQKSYSEIKDNQIVATEVLTFYNTLEDQTEVAEFDSEYNLKVYPNPASDYVVFDIGNTRQLTTVELYDLKGNKISTQQLPSNNQVSVSKLKSGLYIYKIVCDSKISSGKIRVK